MRESNKQANCMRKVFNNLKVLKKVIRFKDEMKSNICKRSKEIILLNIFYKKETILEKVVYEKEAHI